MSIEENKQMVLYGQYFNGLDKPLKIKRNYQYRPPILLKNYSLDSKFIGPGYFVHAVPSKINIDKFISSHPLPGYDRDTMLERINK